MTLDAAWLDHKLTFEDPKVSDVIVGLSNIDPDRKQATGLTLTEIMQSVMEYIDSQGLDDHERMKNLLGGDSANGHWHLTTALLGKLTNLPDGLTNDHEKLEGLLGGISGQRFHLTKSQLDKLIDLTKVHNALTGLEGGGGGHWYHMSQAEKEKLEKAVTADTNTYNHEELTGLLGGVANAHWHLTKAELDKLTNAPTSGDIVKDHEKLNNLLGGAANNHYHLTSDERNKLLDLTKDHNSLTGLQGGSSTERYHVTQELANKLATLHNVLSHETWTFALDSDVSATVNKEVTLWATA